MNSDMENLSIFGNGFKAAASLCLAVLLAGCSDSDLGAGFPDMPVTHGQQHATGTSVVSSAHPLASQAGRDALAMGGNAADAAVATGFALAVVENSMSGLGGRAQILLRTPEGKMRGIDAHTELGQGYSAPFLLIDWDGAEVVGVPGMVAGLIELHRDHGSLPLESLLAPAIAYAKDGYSILPGEVSRHRRVEKKIREDEGLAQIFLNSDGQIHSAGDNFQQADLARTLELIAETNGEAFYKGDIAQRMVQDLQARGAGIEFEDLAQYQVREANLVKTSYRGFDVVSMAGPGNGTAVIAALNVLEKIDNLGQMTEAEWALVVGQVMAAAMQATLFDDSQDERFEETISAQSAQAMFDSIDLSFIGEVSGSDVSDTVSDNITSGESQSLAMNVGDVDWSGESHGSNSHHTTHYVTADDQGMVVTITQTLGPNMGAKVMTPGLGFLYAQTGGMPSVFFDFEPGDRPRTSIAPTIVLKNGRPVMALGAAGGPLIPPAIVQVISRVIDRGHKLNDAVAAPRISPKMSLLTMSFQKETMLVERTPVNGWGDLDVSYFQSQGIEVKSLEKYSLFGRVNALGIDSESGQWTAVADPDWEGSAHSVKPEAVKDEMQQ